MKVHLFELPGHPNEIAVSKIDSPVVDGAFFLDFSRPIETRRRFGFLVNLLVPVIHQGEQQGGYVIGVHRNDPRFSDVRALWKARYPSRKTPPAAPADGIKIIADFATQFPNDC